MSGSATRANGPHTRKALMIACALGIVVVAGSSAAPPPSDPKVAITGGSLSASDLAYLLDVTWWSFKLKFPKPIGGVSLQPCEFKRRPDGSWDRTDLGTAMGIHWGTPTSQIDACVLNAKDEGKRLVVRIGEMTMTQTLERELNLDGTIRTSNLSLIEGTIALALESKDPHIYTGRPEDLVRVIGLAMTTSEPQP